MVNATRTKVLVLGGTGFLGAHVMRLLAAHSDVEVVSLSRREGTDILNLPELSARMRTEAPAVIINCAAHVGSVHYVSDHAADTIRDNMQMVINIYEAIRTAVPTARIVHPLSNCSYPGTADTHIESAWEQGAVHPSVLGYGSVKRMVYAFAESYRRQYGIRSINWLIANAYGPGDYTDPNRTHALNGIIMRLIEAQRRGDTLFTIWGTGTPLREWVYIEDVARIMVHSLTIDEQLYPVNLAQHTAYSIKDIATIAANALQYDVSFVYDTTKQDGAPIKILDNTAFRAAHPDFEFTPLEHGIRATIDYYRSVLTPHTTSS